MKDISKSFGGVRALNGVHLSVVAGEIHALVGENGAGKSTLMKILAGAVQADSGSIWIEGMEASLTGPEIARQLGIAAIYQEFALARDLSVAENMFLNRLSDGLFINWSQVHSNARAWLAQLGIDLNPSVRVDELSVALQQIVEICKAISENSQVLILDEPTAVLASRESERLFGILRKLREDGVSILYISHRLEEVFRIADRISVLRDGELVRTMKASDTSEDQVIRLMIGRNLTTLFPKREAPIGEEILRVEGLSREKKVRDVSFSLRSGEIVGISGLVGSGRTEAVRLIFGADKKDAGRIHLLGREVTIKSPKEAVRCGLGLLPEDRKNQGVLLDLPVKANVTLSSLSQISTWGWLDRSGEITLVKRLADLLEIKIKSCEDKVSSLSGGNQQKVVLARWLASNCKVIILDEPTRGVDIGARVEIYRLINQLTQKGVGILLVSSDMPEVLGLCDRVLVMRDGALIGELSGKERSEENILRLALGERLSAATNSGPN